MATRLYFVATTPAPISPAFAAWTSTTGAQQRTMSLAKDAATETVTISVASGAGNKGLGYQLISEPLAAQTISGSILGMVRGRELAATDNIDRRWRTLRVFSGDGSTLRGSLLGIGSAASTVELPTTLAGQVIANPVAINTLAVLDGDRIVLEVGYGLSATGTTPQFEMVIGGDGTDHAPPDGDTTGTVPWLEFTADLVWLAAAAPEMVPRAGSMQYGGRAPVRPGTVEERRGPLDLPPSAPADVVAAVPLPVISPDRRPRLPARGSRIEWPVPAAGPPPAGPFRPVRRVAIRYTRHGARLTVVPAPTAVTAQALPPAGPRIRRRVVILPRRGRLGSPPWGQAASAPTVQALPPMTVRVRLRVRLRPRRRPVEPVGPPQVPAPVPAVPPRIVGRRPAARIARRLRGTSIPVAGVGRPPDRVPSRRRPPPLRRRSRIAPGPFPAAATGGLFLGRIERAVRRRPMLRRRRTGAAARFPDTVTPAPTQPYGTVDATAGPLGTVEASAAAAATVAAGAGTLAAVEASIGLAGGPG